MDNPNKALQLALEPVSETGNRPFEVTIRAPREALLVDSGEFGPDGQPVFVNCSSCHTEREAVRDVREAAQLDDFHTGMTFQHGTLSCYACHNPEDPGLLRLADARIISNDQSMNLCAQCHGPQYRDYSNGSHGGMTGYWDLSRGPRTRNHCIDCHDPHAPAYPVVMPAPGPRDRYFGHHSTHSDPHAPEGSH